MNKTGPSSSWATPGIAAQNLVDNRVYSDPQVYEQELRRLFDRCWLFACHESEIPRPGDYLTTSVAESPLLIVHGKDGQLRAFYNTCRHRGTQLTAERCGHANNFRCPYHAWVYSLEGDLIAVPGEEAYAGSGFEAKDFSLLGPRCESIYGLIFVNADPQAPPLRQWLGTGVIDSLATPLAHGDFEVIKYYGYDVEVNWKVFAENVRDGYHVPFVHPFFRRASPPGPYHLFEHGHAVQHLRMDPAGMGAELWDKLRRYPLPQVEEGAGYIVTLFPDINVMLRSSMISIDTQRTLGPRLVRLESRVLGLKSDTEEIREQRRLQHMTWFLGPLEQEDQPVFRLQQAGVSGRGVPFSIIARGANTSAGTRGDDNRLRNFWAQWRAMMGTEFNSLER